MIGQVLIKVDYPAGPVYGVVVVSEPWEAEDDSLVFAEVSYLKMYPFSMIKSF
jgi:hypothetical protein